MSESDLPARSHLWIAARAAIEAVGADEDSERLTAREKIARAKIHLDAYLDKIDTPDD